MVLQCAKFAAFRLLGRWSSVIPKLRAALTLLQAASPLLTFPTY